MIRKNKSYVEQAKNYGPAYKTLDENKIKLSDEELNKSRVSYLLLEKEGIYNYRNKKCIINYYEKEIINLSNIIKEIQAEEKNI